MIVYVDDIMIIANNKNLLNLSIQHLVNHFKDININHGREHNYLGMFFKFNSKCLTVKMEGYIDQILKANNITKKSKSPANNDIFIVKDLPILPEEEQKKMHTVVAQLLYLSTRTRPDILLPVNYLTTRVNKFNQDDKIKLERVLTYLNSTKSLGLKLRSDNIDNIQVTTYSDASYGMHQDSKSHTGIINTIGVGSIYSC